MGEDQLIDLRGKIGECETRRAYIFAHVVDAKPG